LEERIIGILPAILGSWGMTFTLVPCFIPLTSLGDGDGAIIHVITHEPHLTNRTNMMTTKIRNTILATNELEDKNAFDPCTNDELLKAPKVEEAFEVNPVKNPGVLIAIYYIIYF